MPSVVASYEWPSRGQETGLAAAGTEKGGFALILARSRNLEFLVPREHFIPVQVPALVERIACDPELSPEEKQHFRALASLLHARFHFEFLEIAENLARYFDPFNSDRDTLPLRQLQPDEHETCFQEFRKQLEYVLTRSNYRKLSREELLQCLEAENPWGVRVIVDLSRFKDIDFYYRGVREWKELYQPWYAPFGIQRKRRQFSRVAVLVRLPGKGGGKANGQSPAGSDQVLFKLFKDVFLEELKMTSPEIRIRIRLLDKIQIVVSLVTSLIASFMRLLVAAAINPILFFSVLAGSVTALAAAVRNFITCRIRYLERLGANLYNKLVASNQAAFSRLLANAEAEEVKEALLAYYILYKHRDKDLTAEEADQLAEAWLTQQFGLAHVDFEIDDALRKLAEKNLLEIREVPRDPSLGDELAVGKAIVWETSASVTKQAELSTEDHSSGRADAPAAARAVIYKVYDLPSALRRLDEWWDNYFPFANEGCPENNHIADGPKAIAAEAITTLVDDPPPSNAQSST